MFITVTGINGKKILVNVSCIACVCERVGQTDIYLTTDRDDYIAAQETFSKIVTMIAEEYSVY